MGGIARYHLVPLPTTRPIVRAVEILPPGFLEECRSLEEVDLSPLVHLIQVSGLCLENCTNLKTIRMGPNQPANMLPKKVQRLVVREVYESFS